MPKILDRLPIPTKDDIASVQGEMVRIKAHEIIVWVSLSMPNVVELAPNVHRFPAILDIAHTHNFSIQEQHLIRWAGLRPEMLHVLGGIRQAGRRLPLHEADVWLHRNRPGQRDELLDRPPHRLILSRGIAVHPSESGFPRLPLLGLRAIVSNRLHLAVDGECQSVNLRAPDWRTRLLRWLS
jgi:hypothetical protein